VLVRLAELYISTHSSRVVLRDTAGDDAIVNYHVRPFSSSPRPYHASASYQRKSENAKAAVIESRTVEKSSHCVRMTSLPTSSAI
jgi:hypothetical protein